MRLKFKKVTVVGSKVSAEGAVRLLKRIGAKIKLTTLSDLEKSPPEFLKLVDEYECKTHSEEFIKGQDLIVTSPGVPKSSPVFKWAKKYNVRVISEIELAYNFCDSFIIGVTGTNGKTTTTYLLEKVLRKFGFKAVSCGNIGRSFSSVVIDEKPQIICLELSSFQLENIINFRPNIGVILNITPDHLDRYKSFKEYVKAKFNIFKNQKKTDFSLLNFDYEFLIKKSKSLKSRVIFFKASDKINEDFVAILSICFILGIDEKKALDYLKTLKLPPHRTEFVKRIQGIDFYNDSKATNIHSTLFSLKNLRRKVILLAGGEDKNQDFNILKDNEIFKEYVKKIVVFGKAKSKLKDCLKGFKDIFCAQDLKEAVLVAFEIAKKNKINCVLLSPMCASFDSFKNFEERGDFFKKIVKDLECKKKF